MYPAFPLPQAVVHYQDYLDTRSYLPFVDLVPKLNSSLHNYPKFPYIHEVHVE